MNQDNHGIRDSLIRARTAYGDWCDLVGTCSADNTAREHCAIEAVIALAETIGIASSNSVGDLLSEQESAAILHAVNRIAATEGKALMRRAVLVAVERHLKER